MRLVLDGAGIVQRTFLNREMTDDRFCALKIFQMFGSERVPWCFNHVL